MKALLFIFLSFFAWMGQPDPVEPAPVKTDSAAVRSEPIDKDNCTCKGIPLHGRVQVRNSQADFRVEIVDIAPDLYVQIVDFPPYSCGQWVFVDHAPDFTVEFVEHAPDFKIEYRNFVPGIP